MQLTPTVWREWLVHSTHFHPVHYKSSYTISKSANVLGHYEQLLAELHDIMMYVLSISLA